MKEKTLDNIVLTICILLMILVVISLMFVCIKAYQDWFTDNNDKLRMCDLYNQGNLVIDKKQPYGVFFYTKDGIYVEVRRDGLCQ